MKVTVDFTSSTVMTHWGFGGLYGIWPWPGAPELTVVFNPLALIAMLYLVRQSQPDGGASKQDPMGSLGGPRSRRRSKDGSMYPELELEAT